MDAGSKVTTGGRERLLDAAEELFAARGYDGASIRAITRRAGVELGLANYHFGSKEELFRQIMLRRAPILSADLDDALVRALRENTLGAIYAAFARTHLERLLNADTGWRSYMRLAADIALKPHLGTPNSSVRDAFRPMLDRYVEALSRFRPDIDRDELRRVFYVFHMAVLSILINAAPGLPPDTPMGLGEMDSLIATMVRIFASGT